MRKVQQRVCPLGGPSSLRSPLDFPCDTTSSVADVTQPPAGASLAGASARPSLDDVSTTGTSKTGASLAGASVRGASVTSSEDASGIAPSPHGFNGHSAPTGAQAPQVPSQQYSPDLHEIMPHAGPASGADPSSSVPPPLPPDPPPLDVPPVLVVVDAPPAPEPLSSDPHAPSADTKAAHPKNNWKRKALMATSRPKRRDTRKP
jgi:hypothetical protein